MSDPSIQSVLNQIRSLRQQAAGGIAQPRMPSPAGATQQAPDAPSFAELIGSGVERVNRTQQQAAAARKAFELGDAGLLDVMLATQKARVEFRAAVEVRNRLVAAYQEIMNMPI